MNTHIISIPHGEQRYPTLGDYWTAKDGATYIAVSEMPDWRYEFLIALHEFIEEALTRHRGISEPEIMAFDNDFGKMSDDIGEPGMSPNAPYHREHVIATGVEMLVATALDVKWADYEAECDHASGQWVREPNDKEWARHLQSLKPASQDDLRRFEKAKLETAEEIKNEA